MKKATIEFCIKIFIHEFSLYLKKNKQDMSKMAAKCKLVQKMIKNIIFKLFSLLTFYIFHIICVYISQYSKIDVP